MGRDDTEQWLDNCLTGRLYISHRCRIISTGPEGQICIIHEIAKERNLYRTRTIIQNIYIWHWDRGWGTISAESVFLKLGRAFCRSTIWRAQLQSVFLPPPRHLGASGATMTDGRYYVTSTSLPKQFRIWITNDTVRRPARVGWTRSAERVGVL